MALVRKCPTCDTSNPDEGHYLTKCSNYGTCGYCRHASISDGKCDDCGEVNPAFVSINHAESAAVEE